MAGFGVSVGDLLAVGTFAWNIYQTCKNASKEFGEVGREVMSLHTTVKELEEEAANPDSFLSRSDERKKTELANILQHCRTALSQLEGLLIEYKSLGTKHKKKWDKIRMGSERLADARSKIVFHTSAINLFMTTMGTSSLGRIEKKLDEIADDVRGGLRSDLSPETFSTEARWWLLQQELVTSGFEKENVATHKDWIQQRFKELIGRDEGVLAPKALHNPNPTDADPSTAQRSREDLLNLTPSRIGYRRATLPVLPSTAKKSQSLDDKTGPDKGYTFSNLPPPPSDPGSPSSVDGAGSVSSLVGSMRSDISVYDYQGRLTSRTVQVRQSYDEPEQSATLDDETDDRLPRPTRLPPPFFTARRITKEVPCEKFQAGVSQAGDDCSFLHSADTATGTLPYEHKARSGGQLVCTCCPKKPRRFDTEGEVWAHQMEEKYMCQYCDLRFKSKNAAERHENSLHLRRHFWSCVAIPSYHSTFHPSTLPTLQTPNGPKYDECRYCFHRVSNFPQPEWDSRLEHLINVHNFGQCDPAKKFYRVDHFRQHLKYSHAATCGEWTSALENVCKQEEMPDTSRNLGPDPSLVKDRKMSIFEAQDTYCSLGRFFEGWNAIRSINLNAEQLLCKWQDPSTGRSCKVSCTTDGELAIHERVAHSAQKIDIVCYECMERPTFSEFVDLRVHMLDFHDVEEMPPRVGITDCSAESDQLASCNHQLQMAHLEKRIEDQAARLQELERSALKFEILFRAQTRYRLKGMELLSRLGLSHVRSTLQDADSLVEEMEHELSSSGVLAKAAIEWPMDDFESVGSGGLLSMQALTSKSFYDTSGLEAHFPGSQQTFALLEDRLGKMTLIEDHDSKTLRSDNQ